MALIKCPECKNEVSGKAKTCPHCGATVELVSYFQEVNTEEKENAASKTGWGNVNFGFILSGLGILLIFTGFLALLGVILILIGIILIVKGAVLGFGGVAFGLDTKKYVKAECPSCNEFITFKTNETLIICQGCKKKAEVKEDHIIMKN